MLRPFLAAALCASPLAALAGPPAPPVIGTEAQFGDWVVGCDNALSCTAVGLEPDEGAGGYIVLRRAAGGGAAPEIFVNVALPDGGGDTIAVAVAGKHPFGPTSYPAEGSGGYAGAVVAGSDALPLLAAIRDGSHLTLAVGGAAPETVSLSGSAAALLRMDAVQGRVGTVTALARPGGAAADTVPTAPTAPGAARLPMKALDTLPPLPAGLKAAADPSCAGVDPLAVDLGGGKVLWGVCDFAAAYNTSFRFWVADGGGAPVPARFAVPGQEGSDPAVLVNPSVGPDGLGLDALNLGRGLGDCGEMTDWAWTGTGFALLQYRRMDACAGVLPDDWPVLWLDD